MKFFLGPQCQTARLLDWPVALLLLLFETIMISLDIPFPQPGHGPAGLELIEIHSKLAHFKLAQYSKPVAGAGGGNL